MRNDDEQIIEHVIDQELIEELADILRGDPKHYDMYRVKAALKRAMNEIVDQAGSSLMSGVKAEEIKKKRERLSAIADSKRLSKEFQEYIDKLKIQDNHMGAMTCSNK